MALVHKSNQRLRYRESDHLGEDQPLGIRNTDRGQRVELFVQAHDPELCGDGRAGASGHQDRSQQWSQLAHARDAEQIHYVHLGTEPAQLVAGQVTQHDPDEKADERQDAHGLGAGAIDSGRDLARWPASRVSNQIHDVEQQAADQLNHPAQLLEPSQYSLPESHDGLRQSAPRR